MKYISELLKGVIIGIANILPGISGGMLAISMGVYDKIIHAVTHILKEPKGSIKTLLPYGAGAVIGVLCFSMIFEYLFGTFPLQTKMAFIGLIGGGLPALFHKVGTGKMRSLIITSGTACILVLFITMPGSVFIASKKIGMGTGGLSLLLIGILAAGTMVIPGVSGSMVMMMLGVYEPLLQTMNACMRAAASGNLHVAGINAMILAPYFSGMAVGIFLFAKIVENLLINHERQVYRVIIGLVCSSPFVILWDINWGKIELHQFLIGISLCLLGFLATSKLKSCQDMI